MALGLDRHAALVGRALALLHGRADRGAAALDGLYGMRGARGGFGTAAAREHDAADHRSKSVLAGQGGVRWLPALSVAVRRLSRVGARCARQMHKPN
jgi:hypothetical protein